MTNAFVLALDGGGTKTSIALADRQGRVKTLPAAAGINAFDNETWRDNLLSALKPLETGGFAIEAAVVGMPGYTESARYDAEYEEALTGLLGPEVIIKNDVFMAYDGTFAGAQGVLALAGTGSMAVSRDADGRYHRAGGWGHDFGDEGSGYWIGREALKRASWAVDGRSSNTEFQKRLTLALGMPETARFGGLLDWLAGIEHKRSGIASLARKIDRMAEDGDAVARSILIDAAEHMAAQIVAVQCGARLDGSAPWSFAGSVFNSRIVVDALSDALGRKAVAADLPPIGGGLLVAAQKAGWDTAAPWRNAIRAALTPA